MKGPAGRFAFAVETTINELATDGWEFVRAETLGAEEREGLMRKRTETFHGVLVFKRASTAAENSAPQISTPKIMTQPKVSQPSSHVAEAEPQKLEPTPLSAPKKVTPEIKNDPLPLMPKTSSRVSKRKASELTEVQEEASLKDQEDK
ncbi:MAG: DUF4177 domain-containing protein [Pseudomonadota bacterium]